MVQANGFASGLVLLIGVCLLATSWPVARAGGDEQEEVGYESGGGGGGSASSSDKTNQAGDLLANKQLADLLSGKQLGELLSGKQLGDLMAGKQLGELMGKFMGNFMGKPQSGATSEHGSGHGSGHGKGEDTKGATKTDLDVNEWVKLMFNPAELVRAICQHFKLDFDKTSTALGKPLVFGYESVLTPLVATAKIVEKVFAPDTCKLLFVCKMGHHLEFVKIKALKLNTKLLEGSQYLRAFSEGLLGRSCEEAFAGCSGGKPKLNKQYEELRERSLEAPQLIGNSALGDVGAASESRADESSESSPAGGAQKATKATVNRISGAATA